MASIERNKRWWNGNEWSEGGNEWSAQYGTPGMQWQASIMPRIQAFIPAATILEIAPGFGRWTHFLKEFCTRLIAVDLSEKCIEACKGRFQGSSHLSFHVNDGRSLGMVEDGSVNFVFSFDSLVHVERDVISSYLQEIAKKLSPDGVAFLHHSNLAPFAKAFAFFDRLPRGRGLLTRMGIVEGHDHDRARSVSAELVHSLAAGAGLSVVSQELINWETRRPIDCISVFTRPGSIWDREYRQVINLGFAREAASIRALAKLYDRSSFSSSPQA